MYCILVDNYLPLPNQIVNKQKVKSYGVCKYQK
nr:MAG TPA: hypothetical protein [Bacteriophage sp.]